MAAIAADVWVLTETRESIAPESGLYGVSTPPHPERRPDPDERWVSIWSRWPVSATGIEPDPSGSVSALIERPDGPLLIYGTVLPWANERGQDGRARMWEVHHREIERQGAEWLELRRRFPDVPLIVAGDFNQDRDGSGWYGTSRGRRLLTDALERASLVCLTAGDVVAEGLLRETHLVDHIAVCQAWRSRQEVAVACWERTDDDGIRLSDHPTVAVDLRPARDRTA
jgi:endonuclease/exonuclease/phosphatase family metal-dependent hydrolase